MMDDSPNDPGVANAWDSSDARGAHFEPKSACTRHIDLKYPSQDQMKRTSKKNSI